MVGAGIVGQETRVTTQGAEAAETPYMVWQRTVAARYADRSFNARNRSGLELDPVYGGLDRHGQPSEMPGQYPYTRGIYPIHYQYQPWMDLQIIGYGVPYIGPEHRMQMLQAYAQQLAKLDQLTPLAMPTLANHPDTPTGHDRPRAQ